jgi:hypothetical protein
MVTLVTAALSANFFINCSVGQAFAADSADHIVGSFVVVDFQRNAMVAAEVDSDRYRCKC